MTKHEAAFALLTRVRADREQAGRAIELILWVMDFLDTAETPTEDEAVFPGHPVYLQLSDGRPGDPTDAEDDDPREEDDPPELNGDEGDYSECGRVIHH